MAENQRLPTHPIHKALAKGDARLETALQTKMLRCGTICPHLNEGLCTHLKEMRPTFMQITAVAKSFQFLKISTVRHTQTGWNTLQLLCVGGDCGAARPDFPWNMAAVMVAAGGIVKPGILAYQRTSCYSVCFLFSLFLCPLCL